jgi:hypothetical protein
MKMVLAMATGVVMMLFADQASACDYYWGAFNSYYYSHPFTYCYNGTLHTISYDEPYKYFYYRTPYYYDPFVYYYHW